MAMKTVDKSILNRMRGSGAGSVSSPRQFLDLSNRSTGGVALHRLVKAGTIRRIRRGLYDLPGAHPIIGQTGPNIMAIIRAVAGRQPCEVAIHVGLHGERTGNVRASAGQGHHLDGWVAAPCRIGEWPAGGNGDPGAALSEGQPCLGAAPGAVQQDPG